ncbi:MAG: hypothetical protein H7245_18560 [Candidatus Saccharibacteria bacterium]|nr:hypothetical protein [Pseudorhodobacter sp.]
MKNGFDEHKFAALLDLAGLDTAMELTQRLDEDLTNLDVAMKATLDPARLHAQSHILLSIAGTIGATRVFDLAKHLNTMTNIADPVGLSAVLAEMLVALNDLIVRIRSTRASQGNAR